jgi:hypothetical protein
MIRSARQTIRIGVVILALFASADYSNDKMFVLATLTQEGLSCRIAAITSVASVSLPTRASNASECLLSPASRITKAPIRGPTRPLLCASLTLSRSPMLFSVWPMRIAPATAPLSLTA